MHDHRRPPRWRVIAEDDEPIPFHTERAARLSAALRARDGRARPPAIEHLDEAGRWATWDAPGRSDADELERAAKARNAARQRRIRAARPVAPDG